MASASPCSPPTLIPANNTPFPMSGRFFFEFRLRCCCMFGNGISLSPLASAFGGEYLLSLWSLLSAAATLFAAKWGGGIKTVKSTKWGKANRVRKRGEEDIYLGCNHVFRSPAWIFFGGERGGWGLEYGKKLAFFPPQPCGDRFSFSIGRN